MNTKEDCIQKYQECKRSNGGHIPDRNEFLQFANLDQRQLAKVFGASPYSKLQSAAGDAPNVFRSEPTSLESIMRQYGTLVMELGQPPAYAEWAHRGYMPTESGLRKGPHNLRWSELPMRFSAWVTENKLLEFEEAKSIVAAVSKTPAPQTQSTDSQFERLVKDVHSWAPARRRNSEETYKVELRQYLERLKYKLDEEFGESNYDLLVQGKYAIELKKDPNLSEYDRLFGQIARHLQHQCKVIVLILEATRKDKYDNFAKLVDEYLNVSGNSVDLIRKG